MADNIRHNDDNVQHGIDDNPTGDAGKGAVLGGIGGAVVGGLAGGPVGAVVGAVAGAAASGAGVAAVDAVDNDDNVSGVGSGVHYENDATRDPNLDTRYDSRGEITTGSAVVVDDQSYGSGTMPVTGATYAADHDTDAGGHNIVTGDEAHSDAGNTGLAAGAVAGGLVGTAVGGPVGAVVGGTLGSLAGGVAGDASEAAEEDRHHAHGHEAPGVQTGGYTTAGPDTRGISEKTADAVTGDRVDDKTGGIVYDDENRRTI